jgi:hypothetical protein
MRNHQTTSDPCRCEYSYRENINTVLWSSRIINTLKQGWPTSIWSRANTETFQILRATLKFMALKVMGNLIYTLNNEKTHKVDSSIFLYMHKVIGYCQIRNYMYSVA